MKILKWFNIIVLAAKIVYYKIIKMKIQLKNKKFRKKLIKAPLKDNNNNKKKNLSLIWKNLILIRVIIQMIFNEAN